MERHAIVIPSRPPADKHHTGHDWGDMARYGTQILWAILFLRFTYATYLDTLSLQTGYIWCALIVLGSLLAIYGRWRFRLVTFELVGVLGITAGWITYSLIQIIVGFAQVSDTRWALAVLGVLAGWGPGTRLAFLFTKFLQRLGVRPDGIVLERGKGSGPNGTR